MVTEHAHITVKPGAEADFEAAFATAQLQLASSPGFLSATLSRGIESGSTYLLLAQWETLEAHTEVFRGSERFVEWRRQLGPFFAAPPEVVHYREVAQAGPVPPAG